MRNFIFHNPVKIYFGEGQAVHVAEEAKSRSGAVLLVYGGGSIKRNGAYDDVTAALHEAGNEVVELSGVTPNPRLDKVLEGGEPGQGTWCVPDPGRRRPGRSSTAPNSSRWAPDWARTRTCGTTTSKPASPPPENLVPIGVVLTTAATGSEMGDAAVLTNWSRNRKLATRPSP